LFECGFFVVISSLLAGHRAGIPWRFAQRNEILF
jgi:hypothetical protein